MTVEFSDVGQEAAAGVHAVTQAAYRAGPPLDPPSGALAETVDTVAADLAAYGGVLGTVDGVPVAALRYRHDADTTTLRRVAVVADRWRHGFGSRLVTHAHAALARLSGVERLSVGVRVDRPGARRFWERLGYAAVARHDHWDELTRAVPIRVHASTAEELREIGERLGRALVRGDVVVAVGPLGAGKTTLTQGLARGLGIEAAVTSPTFVLAREHRAGAAGIPLVHVDAYRLGGVTDPLGEVDALDLDATIEDSVTVVEWGEGLVEGFSVSRIEVRIDFADEGIAEAGEAAGAGRIVVIDPLGPRHEAVIEKLTKNSPL